MSQPILITGAAGGRQGSTGKLVASALFKQGVLVRALVHKLDAREARGRVSRRSLLQLILIPPDFSRGKTRPQ